MSSDDASDDQAWLAPSFREKYGESNKLVNFFLGSHSRPTDRIRNIEKELALNYQ